MLEAAWGKAHRAVAAALEDAHAARVAERIWARDPSLWSDDDAVRATISNRLGWLDAVEWSRDRLDDLRRFREEASSFVRVTLLGMGGSSLAPEVLATVFGAAGRAHPNSQLTVLDSTDPSEVLAAERMMHPDRTLFTVASKSGETIETRSHAAYFLDRTGAPNRFIAITDPGSPLEALASDRGFHRTFLNPPDIGGRYSALSWFGLVPAASLGIDPETLLDSAGDAMQACRAGGEHNPGLVLGVGLAELARHGRDKVTFLASPALEAFGAWAEQLLAESSGKDGAGLIPVAGEPLGSPEVYGDDRTFVFLRSPESNEDDAVEALRNEGHPVVTLDVPSPEALGAQFFLWEFATAVAGWRLGINPFDEPNVSESKHNTARLIEAYVREGALPAIEPVAEENGVFLFDPVESESVTAGLDALFGRLHRDRYVAILGFVPRTPEVEDRLRTIRAEIRDVRKFATCVGFGPRYLHSTGQLHKGGPDSGLFLQITADHPDDVAIPGQPYTFGVLQAAQAAGDYEALLRRGRRVVRLHLTQGVDVGLPVVADMVHAALPR